jgi:hypothetical protein
MPKAALSVDHYIIQLNNYDDESKKGLAGWSENCK